MSKPKSEGPHKTKAPDSESVLLTVEEAAKVYGLPYTSLLQWIHEGLVPFVQPPGKKRYYVRRTAMNELIDKWEQQSA